MSDTSLKAVVGNLRACNRCPRALKTIRIVTLASNGRQGARKHLDTYLLIKIGLERRKWLWMIGSAQMHEPSWKPFWKSFFPFIPGLTSHQRIRAQLSNQAARRWESSHFLFCGCHWSKTGRRPPAGWGSPVGAGEDSSPTTIWDGCEDGV